MYIILSASVLLVVGAVVAWRISHRRSSSSLIGFREYVRNPALRERLSGIFERRDATTALLAKLPPDQLVEELLDDDGHDLVRKAIKLNKGTCVDSLLRAVSDPRFRRPSKTEDVHVMLMRSMPLESVVQCLGDLHPARAVPALAPLAKDANDSLRKHAAFALGKIATPNAIDPLTLALRDTDQYVCTFALMGITAGARRPTTAPEFRSRAFDLVQPFAFHDYYDIARHATACLLALHRTRAVQFLTSPDSLTLDRPGLKDRLRELREARVKVDESALLRLIHFVQSANNEAHDDALAELLRHLAHSAPSTPPEVFEQFAHSASKDVREAAVEALAIGKGVTDPFGFGFDELDKHDWEGVPNSMRLALAVRSFIDQVCNGGFSQYFLNSSGQRWRDTLEGLEAIGAGHDLALLKKAVALFGEEPPAQDDMKRHEQLAAFRNETNDDPFDSLDSEFYQDPDGREILLMRFIVQHAADFKPAR